MDPYVLLPLRWWLASLLVLFAVANVGDPIAAQKDPGRTQNHEPAAETAVRLEQVTRPLLGVPYVLSPLGEGSGVDDDPRYRLDAFDCTTFVETALGLALFESASANLNAEETKGKGSDESLGNESRAQAMIEILDRLRYRGRPSYGARLHFIAAQWLPHWRELGLIEDSTEQSLKGVQRAGRVELHFDAELWRKRKIARDLVLPEEHLPFGTVELPYVPVELARQVLEAAPAGTLINVIRRPTLGRPLLVSHQALLLDQPNGLRVVRHASAALGRVADQTPQQFVRILSQAKEWPVLGVNLQRLTLSSVGHPD